ncbi:hypothetical protein RHGRI_032955 [Rhododendron griersonianum]|uniref:Uncharacterized protein n=1 Tax=Rhododendron griersonianum TaxID=479676 RepID=A0AAV6IG95_9ERIC|nr:hypothetical protein RHGRI_032955 [Rhododendron griersonianum]
MKWSTRQENQVVPATTATKHDKREMAWPLEIIFSEDLRQLIEYVMIVLKGSEPMVFGETEEPAAYGELVSIGGLTPDVNKKLSAAISEILETKLSVPKSRFFLKFYDTKRPENWPLAEKANYYYIAKFFLTVPLEKQHIMLFSTKRVQRLLIQVLICSTMAIESPFVQWTIEKHPTYEHGVCNFYYLLAPLGQKVLADY